MSEFFRRYVDNILGDEDFRARHPHFHIALLPIDELAHIDSVPLEGSDLRKYNKALAALLRGDSVERITVDIVSADAGLALAAGGPVLQAARDAGVGELWARVRYLSREVDSVWWTALGLPGAEVAPALQLLTTEGGDPLTAEDGDELVA